MIASLQAKGFHAWRGAVESVRQHPEGWGPWISHPLKQLLTLPWSRLLATMGVLCLGLRPGLTVETQLFTLPREHSWRYVDGAPANMAVGRASFSGTARPGEFYVFQLGLMPSLPTDRLGLEFTALKGANASIPATALHCLSLGGIGPSGERFAKDLRVPAGQVQVLWCGVELPMNVSGGLEGTATLTSGGRPLGEFKIQIMVTGEAVHDHGDGQAGNLSRLRWLDSTAGSQPTLTRPYIPVTAKGRTITVLGRELILAESGLPESITSYFNEANTAITDKGRPVLARPFSLGVVTANGPATLVHHLGDVAVSDLSAHWAAEAKADGLEVATRGSLDYTGSGAINIRLKALKELDLRDVRLDMPVQEKAAKYFMGLNVPGGQRPAAGVAWTWNVAKWQDCFWLGEVNAGLMIRLKDESYVRPLGNIYYHYRNLVLPNSWGNGGKGGITIGKAEDGLVLATAFCGPRRMKSGETLDFNLEIYLTPFKTLNTEQQWAVRFVHPGPSHDPERIENALKEMDAKAGPNVLNIHQAQHAAPFINYPYADENFTELKDIVRRAHEKGVKAKVYYTTRELTQNLKELYALHSMNGEIIFPGPGKDSRSAHHPKGPHQWLIDNLGNNFAPAWVDRINRPGVEWDLSMLTMPDSRWNNFYLEGLKWMVDQAEIDGVYIDDSALDARSLQRARRILDARPGCLMDMHTWNHFNNMAGFANNLNLYMGLLPYLDRLWIGEDFNATKAPYDYWLVEMSGLPFGLMSEMLDKANPWKGLVFGETARRGWSGDPRSLWKAWDDYRIQGTEFLPAFAQQIVSTGNADVRATVYRKKGRSFIAMANWGERTAECTPHIDWKALGLDPAKAALYAPNITGFQPEGLWKPGEAIEIQSNKGFFLVVDEQPRAVSQVKNGAIGGMTLVPLFKEGFTAPQIPDGWNVFTSKKAEMEVLSLANSLTIRGPANLHAGLAYDLPKGVVAVEAEIQAGTDTGQTWGPGIALIWPDGKAIKMNLRVGNKQFGTGAGDGLRTLGGPLDLKRPVMIRILLDHDYVHFLYRKDDKWLTVDTQSRAGRAMDPVTLRIGKMADNGSLADYPNEIGSAGESMYREVTVYGKQ